MLSASQMAIGFSVPKYLRHVLTNGIEMRTRHNLVTCCSLGQCALPVNVQAAESFPSFRSQPNYHFFRVICWPFYLKSLPQLHSVTWRCLYPSEYLLLSEITFLKSLVMVILNHHNLFLKSLVIHLSVSPAQSRQNRKFASRLVSRNETETILDLIAGGRIYR